MSTEQNPADGSGARRPLAVYTDTDDLDPAQAVEMLDQAGFEVVRLETRDAGEIVAAARYAEALLVGYAPITRDMLEQMPQLKIVALLSMGFDNVDVEAAAEHGVWVTNILGAATDEVASHALALALQAARGLDRAAVATRAGGWRLDAEPPLVTTEATLGIVGLGRIGRRLAEFARPLFREIVGTDPMLPDDEVTRAELARVGIRRVGLVELREASDVVSLHVPLTDETERFVDAEFLAAMPAESILVNVSRGALVDEPALVDALDRGHLSAAALDVAAIEPVPADHPFRSHPRVVLTPHIAYLSSRTGREYTSRQARNVISLAEHGRPDTPVNDPTADIAVRAVG